jgi:hypothetical protein
MQRVLDEAPWVPLLPDRDYYAVAAPYRYRPRAGRNLDLASVELAADGPPRGGAHDITSVAGLGGTCRMLRAKDRDEVLARPERGCAGS